MTLLDEALLVFIAMTLATRSFFNKDALRDCARELKRIADIADEVHTRRKNAECIQKDG
jgi:hypothetical protein